LSQSASSCGQGGQRCEYYSFVIHS
jgi:hypothetical protein